MSVSEYNLPNQTNFYKGKVRDVYSIGEDKLVIVASDRVSAFDVILPEGIPFKGQILSKIAAINLEATQDILPNWLEKLPHPNVSIGKKCEPFKIEMVIRGYLAGHAWREYKAGKRIICGVEMPEGLKQNDKFPSPIITPATKAEEGHDEDISREEIMAQGIVSKEDYEQLEKFTYELFQRGTELAAKRDLILVDTKYEFGKIGDKIYLIDEIHTPDSSRYFYKDSYRENQEKEIPQKHLSKEFVREWLMANDFQGKDGQQVPEMTTEVINSISNRYKELYLHLTGEEFVETPMENMEQIIIENI